MRRAFIVLSVAIPILASETRAQSHELRPWLESSKVPEEVPWLESLTREPDSLAVGLMVPAQVIQAGGNHGPTPAIPFQPIGNPTAWVSAKDVANLTMSPGGNASATSSCVNKGSAGGTFAQTSPNGQPIWYDDGYLGAGLPYFWFTGTSQVKAFVGQFPASAYITASSYTAYAVMYAHVLTGSAGEPSQIPTVLRFSDTGFGVTGGGARVYNRDQPAVWADYLDVPVTSGDATLHVWKFAHAGGVLSISVDGGVPVTIASGNTDNMNGLTLLGFDCCSFNAGSLYGAISEWVAYNRALTPGEDRAVMAYLRKEWRTP